MSLLTVVRVCRGLMAAGVGVLGVGLVVPAAEASRVSCQRVRTPNMGSVSELLGVAVTSTRTAWAVGWYGTNINGSANHPLIEHWNAGAWGVRAAPIPAGGGPSAELTAVAAISARNAWAVGWYGPNGNGYEGHPLIEHWNGTAWTAQAAASVSAGTVGGLTAVAATSAHNAWAVGWYGTSINGAYQKNPFIEHWNGNVWAVQAPPPGDAPLLAVTATSARDVWVVGGNQGRSLIEHWNGRSWKARAASGNKQLLAVAATSSKNAWAVGDAVTGRTESDFDYPITEHWNGTAWRNQPGPYSLRRQRQIPMGPAGQLSAVVAASPTSAWAVGDVRTNPFGGVDHPAVEHWNGRTWKAAFTPHATDTDDQRLFGVATAKAAGDVWAVGIRHAYTPHAKTLALHCR